MKKYRKTFVIGDIHGNYLGLEQALERSGFIPEEDLLISLGDLVDGGLQSYEVIELLSSLPNIILIKGNHDVWFVEYLDKGYHPIQWTQGGHTTAISYINNMEQLSDDYLTSDVNKIMRYVLDQISQKHKDFLRSALPYYKDKNNNLFIHGGFDRMELLEDQEEFTFYWNRDLWKQALSAGITKLKFVEAFNDIFIGHTTTLFQGKDEPMYKGGIYNLDTGAGSSGKVTVMDIETKDYWQSDKVADLYGKNFTR